MRLEHRDLAVELEDAAVDDRLVGHHRGVVEQIAGGEVIGSVDDDVVVLDDVEDVVRAQGDRMLDDVDVRD